jgi:HK97 family phage prohead protease
MADSTLNILRKEAFLTRVKGIAGGNKIHWSMKQQADLQDLIMSTPEEAFRTPLPQHKFVDSTRDLASVRAKLAASGTLAAGDGQPSGNAPWIFCITSPTVDLQGDSVKSGAAQFDPKNLPVLFSHDSASLPIARSSPPWMVDQSTLAIANFPAPGISSQTDQVSAMVRARQVKGASIGFIPIRYTMSKDPARPFGVDFLEIRLIEWSIVSIPCNQGCWAIGPANSKSATRRRNIPLDEVPAEDNDWECHGIDTMPIDASDDAYNQTAAKAALLANFSASGTILEEARDYFLAVDISAPFDASSFQFPFCRAAGGDIVASKVGWRQSFAALEKSTMPGIVISEARALVDRLEARLGDVKTAARRREARAVAARARSICASIPDRPVPTTREQRLAEARKFRRLVDLQIARSIDPSKGPMTLEQSAARDRLTLSSMAGGK